MSQMTVALPNFEHFQLEQIAEGIFAVIAIEGGAAFSNAGIVDLGDRTLIFDTFETPKAAEDLRVAAEHLTGRPATYVVNSHAHPDHWLGNQVFVTHATIIATHGIREQMLEFVGDIEALINDPTDFKEAIRENRERLEDETDQRRRASLEAAIARMYHTLEALPTLAPYMPNQTFEGQLVFYGTQRKAELLTWGVGHTSSDCFLVLPAEKVAFMGDLAFFQCQPFMPYGDPQAWVAQLEKMEQTDIETFVPGHGPLGTKADLALQRQYIAVMEEQVARWVRDGIPVEEAIQQPLPERFETWSSGVARFEANVRFWYQRLKSDLGPS